MPRKLSAKGGEKDKNCEWNCIKRDLERVGEERRKRATDRKKWRLQIGAVMKQMRGRKRTITKCKSSNRTTIIWRER